MRTPQERRSHPRFPAAHPCKVFRHATQRYTAARTCDLSGGGMLLEIESPRPLLPGERIGVGVAWTPSVILSEAAMREAIVVRVEELGEDRQAVAVRFAEPVALAQRLAA